jgi:hypothetical protein
MGIKKFTACKEDKIILESAQCREIIHEILNFGVNQSQLHTLIKLLSLELENIDAMKKITEIIDSSLEKENVSNTTTILI